MTKTVIFIKLVYPSVAKGTVMLFIVRPKRQGYSDRVSLTPVAISSVITLGLVFILVTYCHTFL